MDSLTGLEKIAAAQTSESKPLTGDDRAIHWDRFVAQVDKKNIKEIILVTELI